MPTVRRARSRTKTARSRGDRGVKYSNGLELNNRCIRYAITEEAIDIVEDIAGQVIEARSGQRDRPFGVEGEARGDHSLAPDQGDIAPRAHLAGPGKADHRVLGDD